MPFTTADLELLLRRVSASAINCTVAFTFGMAFPEYWREAALGFFFFQQRFERCLGMIIVGLAGAKKPPLLYTALYTTGFACVLFHVYFPGDLTAAWGFGLQVPCYLLTGNTFHAWLTGMATKCISD